MTKIELHFTLNELIGIISVFVFIFIFVFGLFLANIIYVIIGLLVFGWTVRKTLIKKEALSKWEKVAWILLVIFFVILPIVTTIYIQAMVNSMI